MPKKLTQAEFIKKAKLIHGNFYDYFLTVYKNMRTKIKIICPHHGIFEQDPHSHIQGYGCIKCGGREKLNTSIFISRSKQIHGDTYDYSLVNYTARKNKVKIICPIHGVFEQQAHCHLLGQGCFKCASTYHLNLATFIERAALIHNNKYDYSLVDYKNMRTKIKIKCPKHGIFIQKPSSHLNGSGCPYCKHKFSKDEKEIVNYIKSIYSGLILENTRDIIKPKELDIYLPELKLAFEYDGTYWHNLQEEKNPGYHELKDMLCKEKDITLIHIKEYSWKNNKNLIKEKINKLLCKKD